MGGRAGQHPPAFPLHPTTTHLNLSTPLPSTYLSRLLHPRSILLPPKTTGASFHASRPRPIAPSCDGFARLRRQQHPQHIPYARRSDSHWSHTRVTHLDTDLTFLYIFHPLLRPLIPLFLDRGGNLNKCSSIPSELIRCRWPEDPCFRHRSPGFASSLRRYKTSTHLTPPSSIHLHHDNAFWKQRFFDS